MCATLPAPPDPFANETKYPGVKLGARGKTVPVGSYYGEPTGVVGLRLFPNPDFDEQGAQAMDAERYYRDAGYYDDRDLVQAVPCGHVLRVLPRGTEPVNPPADPENPQVGEPVLQRRRAVLLVGSRLRLEGRDQRQSFLNQSLRTSLPGTLDTSLVSSDNINNPRTMNAVYYLGPRMGLAKRWGKERLREAS